MSKIFDSIKVYGSGTTNSSSTLDTYDSSGTTTFTIKDGGNVGIGTSTPLTTLHVNGKATIQGDVDVFGNVNVLGTATTLNTETVQTRDNKILLNYSGTNVTAVGGGISVLSANTIYTSGLTELITDINGDWNSNVGLNITGRTSDNSSNGLTVKNSGNTDLLTIKNNGIHTFNSILDGESSGNNNFIFSTTSGGIRTGYYGNIGYGSSFDYFTNNVLGSQTQEYSGYYITRVKNFWSVRTLLDNKSHLFMDGSTGYVGIGDDGFSPTSSLHIKGLDSSPSNYGLKVQDSGGTDNFVVRNDGNVGIGVSSPSERLDVSGKTKTTNLQVTSGSPQVGYVLTATDTSGNMSWQVQNTFTGGTVTGGTNFTGNLSANTLTVNGQSQTQTIIPSADNSYPLGSTNRRWSSVYTKEIRLFDRTGGASANDYITILAPTDLATTPDPAWSLVLPYTTGGTFSLLGVYDGSSNTSNTSWFTLSAGTNISLNQVAFSGGSVITINSIVDSFYVEPSSTAVTWNVSGNSSNYELTLTANTTLNLNNVRNGDYGTIILTQDSGGNRTVTLGTVNGAAATHKVVNGGAGLVSLTTTANAIDILSFTYDGTNMYWNKGLNYT
jgi:hypothetical protein